MVRPGKLEEMVRDMRALLVRTLEVNEEYERVCTRLSEERDLYKTRVVELGAQVEHLRRRLEEAELGRALALDDRDTILSSNALLRARLNEDQSAELDDRLELLRASGELHERMIDIGKAFR